MKKLFIVLFGLLLLSGVAYAESMEIEKKTEHLTVRASLDKNPPAVGENTISLELIDGKGKAITDATVEISYFMPAMPAMLYKAGAELKNDKYSAGIKLVMAGHWDINVTVKSADGKTRKVTFSIEAK